MVLDSIPFVHVLFPHVSQHVSELYTDLCLVDHWKTIAIAWILFSCKSSSFIYYLFIYFPRYFFFRFLKSTRKPFKRLLLAASFWMREQKLLSFYADWNLHIKPNKNTELYEWVETTLGRLLWAVGFLTSDACRSWSSFNCVGAFNWLELSHLGLNSGEGLRLYTSQRNIWPPHQNN